MKKLLLMLSMALFSLFAVAETTTLSFSETASAGSLNGQTLGSGNLTLTVTDANSKVAVDANTAYFGSADEYVQFTKRLKTGGKSSSSNKLTLTIGAAGTLTVYARTGDKSATDRNVVFTQGSTELINHILLESEKVTGQDESNNDITIYTPFSCQVAEGDVNITYPVNGVYFYGFKLVTEDAPAATKTVYFQPTDAFKGNNGARYAVYSWDASGNVWTDMTLADECRGIYSAVIPSAHASAIFCSMKSDAENKWDNKVNQTADITSSVEDGKYWTLTGNTSDGKYTLNSVADYNATPYSITYKANGGTGNDIVENVSCGATHTVKAADTFTRANWSFVTWKQTGTGTAFAPGSTIDDITSSTTLFAHWETWMVRGDFNGDGQWEEYQLVDGVATIPVTAGGDREFQIMYGKTDTEGQFYKNNGTMTSTNCSGWDFATSAANNCHITPTVNGEYTFTFDTDTKKLSVTYPETKTITFNKNDGSDPAVTATQTVAVNYATALSTVSSLNWTVSGDRFLGWATTADGDVVYNDGANITATDNVTLYAIWDTDFRTGWKLNIWVGPGDNNWGTYDMEYKRGESNTIGYYTLTCPKAGEHDFELVNGSDYYKNSGTMSADNCSNWPFSGSESRGKINCSKPGNYIFKVDFTDGTPVVSVTYPGSASMFEDYFTCSNNNNSYYTISGKYSNDKGTVDVITADGTLVTLDYCLKMESSTNVTFTTATACTLKMAIDVAAGKVKVDGTDITATNGVIDTEIAAGEHTIAKKDVCNLFYINLYNFKSTLAAQSGENHYATFSSDKAVKFTDATVYTVSVSNNTIALHEVENKQVPANTGVLLMGDETATFNYIDGATALSNNNLMPGKGTTTVAPGEGTYAFYRLAYGNFDAKTGLGFYYGATDGAAFVCKAGTAYLAVENITEAPRRAFYLLDATEETGTATDVESVEAQEVVKFFENGQLLIKKNGVVYNVMGQVVR